MTAFRISRISPTVARRGALAAGLLALLAALFIGVGIILPATVEVTRSAAVDAAPEDIFPFLDDLGAWSEWTPWGDVESRFEGPSSGPGARRVWDDPGIGAGSLTISATRPPHSLDYVVEVEGGALRFVGTITLEERAAGSVVTWTERAEMGWNPLLRWTALGLEESQGRQLQESLDRLAERLWTARPDAARPDAPTASPEPA